MAAFLSAHQKWGNHPDSTLEKVVLIITNPKDVPGKPFWEVLKKKNIPFSCIEYRKGKGQLLERFPIPEKKYK